MRGIKKILLFVLGLALILVVIVIAFASPLAKYLVEKYDVKYTGREIKMNWAYVNPFTGYVYFNNFKAYEYKSDSLFFSAKGVGADFSILKLFSKAYEIELLTLEEPQTQIIQTHKKFNLDDLIEKFSSKKKTNSITEPVRFSILNIKINNGEIRYFETITPINISIKQLNLESTGIRWNSDTISAKFSFLSGIGKGDMKGDFSINSKNFNYCINSIIHGMDLNFVNQYLKDLINYGNFRAVLDADLKTSGNFYDSQNLNAKGRIVMNEFHYGKDSIEEYASFKKLVVGIEELDPGNRKYLFDTLFLSHPYFKYEQYDYLDNLQEMFGKKGIGVTAYKNDPEKFNLVLEIGKYIKLLSENFFSSYYQIKRLDISNGNMLYNDYSLNEKFTMAASPLFVTADSIDRNHERVKLVFKSSIKPYGNAHVSLSINPNDSSDFDLSYHLQKLPITMFNPYLISYTSFPLDRGTIEINGHWKVRNGFMQSTNHLLVLDPRLASRIRKKDSKWIPLPLVMAFVRERGNVIDYEIPIIGNMKHPKFKLKDVVTDIVKNIFVKPPTIPYGFKVRNVENELEKLHSIKWEMRQSILSGRQEKFIRKLAEFLLKNPKASVAVYPIEYSEKEKEGILFFEAKKKYFSLTHNKNNASFDKKDSLETEKIPIKDPTFVKYLVKCCQNPMFFTIQQKCYCFIGAEVVSRKFKQLEKDRENAFRTSFIQNGTNNRLKIHATENKTPYNGFSYYEIKYKGDIPESLKKAYNRMMVFDEESPRKKFRKQRNKLN